MGVTDKKEVKGRCKSMKKRVSRDKLCKLCRSGELWNTVDDYLDTCRSDATEQSVQSGKRPRRQSRFPNLAGLCRHAQAGIAALGQLRQRYPDEYDRLLAIFEDEALNAELSPTLLSAYMKKRMLYSGDDAEESPKKSEVRYYFEHDILSDGE